MVHGIPVGGASLQLQQGRAAGGSDNDGFVERDPNVDHVARAVRAVGVGRGYVGDRRRRRVWVGTRAGARRGRHGRRRPDRKEGAQAVRIDRIVLDGGAAGGHLMAERHGGVAGVCQPPGRIGEGAARGYLRNAARAVHVVDGGRRRLAPQQYARRPVQDYIRVGGADLDYGSDSAGVGNAERCGCGNPPRVRGRRHPDLLHVRRAVGGGGKVRARRKDGRRPVRRDSRGVVPGKRAVGDAYRRAVRPADRCAAAVLPDHQHWIVRRADHDVGRVGQRAGPAGLGQAKVCKRAPGAAYRGARLQGARARIVQGGGRVALLHRVPEHQRVRAAARCVLGGPVGIARLEQQAGQQRCRPVLDGDAVGEPDGNVDRRARKIGAVGRRRVDRHGARRGQPDHLDAAVVARGHGGVCLAARLEGGDRLGAGERVKAAVAVARRAGGLERAVGEYADQLDAAVARRDHDRVRRPAHLEGVGLARRGKLVKVADALERVDGRAGGLQGAVGVDADELDGAGVGPDAASVAARGHYGVRVVAHREDGHAERAVKRLEAAGSVGRRAVADKGWAVVDANELDAVAVPRGDDGVLPPAHLEGLDVVRVVYLVKAVIAVGGRVGGLQGAVGVYPDQLDAVVGQAVGPVARGRDCVRVVVHVKGVDRRGSL